MARILTRCGMLGLIPFKTAGRFASMLTNSRLRHHLSSLSASRKIACATAEPPRQHAGRSRLMCQIDQGLFLADQERLQLVYSSNRERLSCRRTCVSKQIWGGVHFSQITASNCSVATSMLYRSDGDARRIPAIKRRPKMILKAESPERLRGRHGPRRRPPSATRLAAEIARDDCLPAGVTGWIR